LVFNSKKQIILKDAIMQTQFTSIFSRFYRVSAKVNMVLTPVLHEILVGSMVGDLTAERKVGNGLPKARAP
jgi:hypothetical protein